MRRADRLFQLIQILRRVNRPVTAAKLAEELEVSKRTVYRDIADLVGQRVPIEGEVGLGYTLSEFYNMPPLMFTRDELEALVLGVQLVQSLPDKTIGNSAKDVFAKIRDVIPPSFISTLSDAGVRIKPRELEPEKQDTRYLREAIRANKKIRITYFDRDENKSERVVWPIILGYDEVYCLLIAWCEQRQQYRHFRVDRIRQIDRLDTSVPIAGNELRQRWELWREQTWLNKC
ncbi:helix-turn-helix transcriptional regulator [Marinomonas polaris]|uniref:helix-turn-helix transcriptional regulator n=1 Tax=Marinomonas polaris TaxID=293552 RepID=UPI00351648B0